MKAFWFKFNIGEYLSDTIGLSNAEHGAYLMAILAYHKKREALDDAEMRAICKSEFARVSRFFILSDGLWRHKRIDQDMNEMAIRMDKAKTKSLKGVEARRALGQIKSKGHWRDSAASRAFMDEETTNT